MNIIEAFYTFLICVCMIAFVTFIGMAVMLAYFFGAFQQATFYLVISLISFTIASNYYQRLEEK